MNVFTKTVYSYNKMKNRADMYKGSHRVQTYDCYEDHPQICADIDVLSRLS